MVSCCICKASGTKGFFKVPTGPRRADYLEIAGLPPESELKVKIASLKICFRHFHAKDLVVVGDQVRISKGEFIKSSLE